MKGTASEGKMKEGGGGKKTCQSKRELNTVIEKKNGENR